MAKDTDRKKVEKVIETAIKDHERERQSSPACGPVTGKIYEALKGAGMLKPAVKEA